MDTCPECHVAILEPHPELQWWRKCPVCGFCNFNLNKVPAEYKQVAAANPLTKVPHLCAEYLFKDGYAY